MPFILNTNNMEDLIEKLKVEGKLLELNFAPPLSEAREKNYISVECNLNNVGNYLNPAENPDDFFTPIPYTHILLKKGVKGERMLVEIEDIIWDYLFDENGEIVTYNDNGETLCMLEVVYKKKRIVE